MRERVRGLACAAILAAVVAIDTAAGPGAGATGGAVRAANEAFSMVVADVFTITGKGVVVTGRIESGTVEVGDEVCLSGEAGKRTVTIEGIEHFREMRESAKAGEDVGLLLGGVEKSDVAKKDRLTGRKC